MPCWYYDKADLLNTPSYRDGLDPDTEARYRREGARFIIDTGTKMGLRYDTCATGVVFFHRFYMFHSFKEFHRYVTSACCLFLAGKVEETPKKCKDIIKTARGMLDETQFKAYGENPKEEVMTLERILLQTIKFDLQIEHPYKYLLKYAKQLKGDKTKLQKMVQMGWTFVNDSLCTTLCLHWEPEVIAVGLIYLASRLSKCDISDWHGKQPGFKGKWWEVFVEDVTIELIEEICHSVLDLYSGSKAGGEGSARYGGNSPPPPPPDKRDRESRKRKHESARDSKRDRYANSGRPPSRQEKDRDRSSQSRSAERNSKAPQSAPPGPQNSHPPVVAQQPPGGYSYTSAAPPGGNTYTYSNMAANASFMSGEGAADIQNILSSQGSRKEESSSNHGNYNQPPPPSQVYSQPQSGGQFSQQQQPQYQQQQQAPLPQQNHQQQQQYPPQQQQAGFPQQQQPGGFNQQGGFNQAGSGNFQQQNQPPVQQQQYNQQQQQFPQQQHGQPQQHVGYQQQQNFQQQQQQRGTAPQNFQQQQNFQPLGQNQQFRNQNPPNQFSNQGQNFQQQNFGGFPPRGPQGGNIGGRR
ncbi:unnamed protein product [Owenia fusiformis]|uniref:Uncharacterized protein n=1 Tax=Owenia fusiformis TaxID=6347 RepID=A0A8J1Y5S4_OWEFU|nr:unnamed protein product [Owenia fusiformis]